MSFTVHYSGAKMGGIILIVPVSESKSAVTFLQKQD